AVSAGILVRLRETSQDAWALSLVGCTGSKAHLKKLSAVTGPLKALGAAGPWPTEAAFYESFGLAFIEPELREGHDEVDRAACGPWTTGISIFWVTLPDGSCSSAPATSWIWSASSGMPGNSGVSSKSIQAPTVWICRRRMRALPCRGAQKLPYRLTRIASGSSV